MENTELYYHTYDGKYGYQAEVFTSYNDALEFLNDHQEDYIGTVQVSSNRKTSGFSDMRNALMDYLKELESEEKHNASLRDYSPCGSEILNSLLDNIAGRNARA